MHCGPALCPQTSGDFSQMLQVFLVFEAALQALIHPATLQHPPPPVRKELKSLLLQVCFLLLFV